VVEHPQDGVTVRIENQRREVDRPGAIVHVGHFPSQAQAVHLGKDHAVVLHTPPTLVERDLDQVMVMSE
jgi:hypothetical protein